MANIPKELIKSVPSSEPQPEVQIKKFKQCQGHDGIAFSCDLYVNGKLSAHITQDGNGGMGGFYWVDNENEKIWNTWRKGLDAYLWNYDGESKSMPHDDDMALEFFLSAHDMAKWIKRNRKTKCMVQLKDEPLGSMHSLKYSPNMGKADNFNHPYRNRMEKEYGDKILFFADDLEL